MSHEDLIEKAKSHVSSITPAGGARLSAADFPQARVQDVAMISFRSTNRPDRVYVFLERDSGEFVTTMYTSGFRGQGE